MAVKALLHYALEVPDQGAGEKFYSNFGLIDAPGRDGAVRLRPAPLQRESVLLYGGPRKRLHHLAFGAPGDEYAATREAVRRAGIREVDPPRGAPEGGNVDEIAMGAAKMQEAGWQPGWGLGRHVIGSNFFYYIRDPWGSFAEYFHDLDYIPEHCAWEPRDFPEAEALYRWGPPVPEDFGLNRELES